MRYDFSLERRALIIIEKRSSSVICCSVARALVRIMAVSIRARTDRRVVMLLAFSLPILVLITVQSLISRTHASWTSPLAPAASILVTAWLLERRRATNALASVAMTGSPRHASVSASACRDSLSDTVGIFTRQIPVPNIRDGTGLAFFDEDTVSITAVAAVFVGAIVAKFLATRLFRDPCGYPSALAVCSIIKVKKISV